MSQSLTGSGTAAESVPRYDRRDGRQRKSRPHLHRGRYLRRRAQLLPTDVTVANTGAVAASTASCTTRPTASCEAAHRVWASSRRARRHGSSHGLHRHVLGNPPSAIEEFVPSSTTTGQSWEQTQIGTPGVPAHRQTSERGSALGRTPAANVRCTAVRQRDGHRVARRRPRRRRLSDLLVPDRDRRHRPRWRLLVRRPCRLKPSAGPSPPSPTRTRAPPRARIRRRSTGATAVPRRAL